MSWRSKDWKTLFPECNDKCPERIIDSYGLYCNISCGKATANENFEAGADKLTENLLTPEEAKVLLYAFIYESQNRYGKVNTEAHLYLKLKRIAEPVLLKIKAQDEK